MLILKLYALQRSWKIVGVTAHDLINWIEGKIDISFHDLRMANGDIKCWVNVGNPDDDIIPLDTTFAKQVMALMRIHNNRLKMNITQSDIADRFRSGGKLWLVLKPNMKVIDEASIRVYGDACPRCRSNAQDGREVILRRRQSDYCKECFVGLLPDSLQWDYVRSTLKGYRHRDGFGADYDPIKGTCFNSRTPRPGETLNKDTETNGTSIAAS